MLSSWITQLCELEKSGKPFAIVTVTRCNGSTPRETGAKMLVLQDGKALGTIGGGQLEQQAVRDALECLRAGITKTMTYPLYASVGQCCGGVVELLMETVNTNPILYLFGAGHVGQALCKTLQGTPFHVHLIDEREEWVHAEGLPAGVISHAGPWRDTVEKLPWDPARTYSVIMTHEHGIDREVLQVILSKPLRYLGMIGSQSKWKSFQDKLRASGCTQDQLNRVRCPIGVETGGKAPQEIAISIAAELLQIHYGVPGGR